MENISDKKILAPYYENAEHLQRHTDASSLTIGSKILSGVSIDDMKHISALFDEEYAKLIEQKGNPGRQVFAIDCGKDMGTDAVVPQDTLREGTAFTIVREPGTRGEAKVKVALIDEKDMPKTRHIHAVYGPYGPTEKAGVYTLIFGDPGMPFPRELAPDAPKAQKEANDECKKYWDSHVFLVTPKELIHAIEAMEEHGMDTKIARMRLKMFQNNPKSPMAKDYHSGLDASAMHLPAPTLPSSQKGVKKIITDNHYGK